MAKKDAAPVVVEETTAAPATVTVVVPKNFRFTGEDHVVIDISAGVQEMTPEMANHWWCKANGVTIYTK